MLLQMVSKDDFPRWFCETDDLAVLGGAARRPAPKLEIFELLCTGQEARGSGRAGTMCYRKTIIQWAAGC